MLARPLIEALRLIIYNRKLREAGLTNQQMTLTSAPVKEQLCTNCAANNIVQRGPFWIIEYKPFKNKIVKHCECPFGKRHFPIESTAEYKFDSQPMNFSNGELQKQIHEVLFQCGRLGCYLRQKGLVNEDDDPFGRVLERFLEEEQEITDKKKNSNLNMNTRVKDTLCNMKQIHQRIKQQLFEQNENLSLKDIYGIIENLNSILALNEQLESIKLSRKLKMQVNEHQVKLPPNKNKLFSQLMDSLH